MTAATLTVVIMVLAGLPVSFAIDRQIRSVVSFALAFLYGIAVVSAAMVIDSLLHIAWSRVSICVTALIVSTVAASCLHLWMRSKNTSEPLVLRWSDLHPFDVVTLLALAGYVTYCAIAPANVWDFWATWGLKGKTFFEFGGMDWAFLRRKFAPHPDYPLLVPLTYAFDAVMGARWDERSIAALCSTWGVALIIIVRAFAARERPSRAAAAAATAAVVPLVVSYEVGYAEGMLIAFAATALLFLRIAMANGSPSAWLHGSLFLGLATNIKNEGSVLLVAVIAAVALTNIRRAVRLRDLWPAYLVAIPWVTFRMTYVAPNEIVSGPLFDRLLQHLPRAGEIAVLLIQETPAKGAWIALILGLLLVRPPGLQRERFLIIATTIELSLCISIYFVIPQDVRLWLPQSWGRVSRDALLPLVFVVMMAFARIAAGERGQPLENAATASEN